MLSLAFCQQAENLRHSKQIGTVPQMMAQRLLLMLLCKILALYMEHWKARAVLRYCSETAGSGNRHHGRQVRNS